MKVIRSLEFHTGSREDKLPGFTAAFPYIALRTELDYYREFRKRDRNRLFRRL